VLQFADNDVTRKALRVSVSATDRLKGLFPYSRATQKMNQKSHQPVLATAAVAALTIRDDGRYLDATFGRGGHSELILQQLGDSGRLVAIDKDPEAVAVGQEKNAGDKRFSIWHGSFAEMGAALADLGVEQPLDGILMDLGVSSPQLDDAARGFSFRSEGPLDMRMNPEVGESAASWLNRADEADIARVIWEFGEERQSRRIARAIVRKRASTALTTTTQLADLIEATIGRRPGAKRHPATRSFQGIRIWINRELDDLERGLGQAIDHLGRGGRLVVISFHSLEDRRVKHFIRQHSQPPGSGRRLPPPTDAPAPTLRRVGGALRADPAELAVNPRARSAVMRVAERI
jgi:16S rRNA (cytosine1402-N4)-methyltransferase